MAPIKKKPTKQTPKKPTKRKLMNYDRTKIKNAIEAIKSKSLSIQGASREYNIPRSTLIDRLHGRVGENTLKMGRNTVLNEPEEKELVKWLIKLAKSGFPRKKSDLLNAVQKIIKEDGRTNTFKDGRPGDKWYNLFLKRHPELSERTAESISAARAVITEEYIRKWYRDLETFLKQKGNEDILLNPDRILNGDETSFRLCPQTGKVVGPKGWKNIYDIKRGSEKETITVLMVFSASGETVTPMVVFPYSRKPPKEIVDSAPSNWFIGISDSGWMRSDVFFEYIANGVHQWLNTKNIQRPVLLLVDGHKSHLTKDLSQFCDDNGIILYALPPNTTHIMQPADVSVFRPIKHQWKNTVKNWQDANSNKKITRATFCPLLHTVLKMDITNTIKNGFRKCGLYPFNPNAIDYTKCVKNIQENMDREEECKPEEININIALKVLEYYEGDLQKEGIDLNKIKNILKNDEPDFDIQNNCPVANQENEELDSDKTFLHSGSDLSISTLNMKGINSCDVEYYTVNNEGVLELEPKTSNNLVSKDFGRNLDTEKCLQHISPVGVSKVTECSIHETSSEAISSNKIMVTAEIHPYSEKNVETHSNNKLQPKLNFPNQQNFDVITTENDDSLPFRSINENLLHRLDIASDFDFSLPASPTTSITSERFLTSSPINITPKSHKIKSYTVSPSFKNHLFAPKTLDFTNKTKKSKEKMPLAISSDAWRKYIQEKEDEKEKVIKNREERKARMAVKKEEIAKQRLKVLQRKQIKKKRATAKSSTQNKLSKCQNKENRFIIKCSGCEEDLISDVEDDDLKNIGCDNCPKWFHLKCTTKRNKTYKDVAGEEFICHHCLIHLL